MYRKFFGLAASLAIVVLAACTSSGSASNPTPSAVAKVSPIASAVPTTPTRARL